MAIITGRKSSDVVTNIFTDVAPVDRDIIEL